MTNREYWKIRAIQQEQKNKEKGEKFLKELRKKYEIAYDEIESEIQKWYEKYAKENNISMIEAMRILDKRENEEYLSYISNTISNVDSEIIEKYMRDKYYINRISRLDSLENMVSINLEILDESVNVQTFEHLKNSYKDNLIVGDDTTIESGFHKFSNVAVEEAVNAPWNGASFSDRLWRHKQKLVDEVRQTITLGIIQGHSIDKMTKKISHSMDINYSSVQRIVRTESNYVLNEARAKNYETTGVKKYEFLATLDYKTSEICQELDKKVFDVDKKQAGLNYPPMHPNCRSTTIPYYDDMEEERVARDSSGKNYTLDGKLSYKKWHNSLSDEEKAKMEYLAKKDKNKARDKIQYEKYKDVLGENAPKSLVEYQEIKYNDDIRYEKLKLDYKDEKLRVDIRQNYNLNIHQGKQDKHIRGTNGYNIEIANGKLKSYLLDNVNPQELVNVYAGTGDIRRDENGKWTNKEFISHTDYVGYNVDIITGEETLTKSFAIHYGKKNGTHIVPRKEKLYDKHRKDDWM